MKGTQAELDSGYLARINASLDADDWHDAYRWAKDWIGSGGGAGLLDPWLVYVGDGLGLGQTRTSIHAVDLALGTWIADDLDRGILLFVRARLIWLHLKDPKTAYTNMLMAETLAPTWLSEAVKDDLVRCEDEAGRNCRIKPTVSDPPDLQMSDFAVATLADRRSPLPAPGTEPPLWWQIYPLLCNEAAA